MTPAPEPVISSIAGTALPPADYLRHLRSDAARLVAVSSDLDAPVPSCPDWSSADLVEHVAAVYSHKTAAMVLGHHPEPGQWATSAPDGVGVLAWFGAELTALVAQLSQRRPDEPCWTWWPPDQTVGFWHRRMAQETLVHRWDAELAAGSTTALNAELAVDGVDEVLGWLAWELDEPDPEATGQVVLVRTTGRAWTVTLGPTSAVVRPAAADGAAAAGGVLEGLPEQLLLHLWGRGPQDAVTQSGDPQALQLFAERLALLR